MTPLHSQVQEAIKQLNAEEAVLFSMGCCQRAFPTFVGMHARSYDMEPPLEILDEAWLHLSNNFGSSEAYFPESFADMADEKMEEIWGEDGSTENEYWGPSQSCCGALIGVLRYRQYDNNEIALFAHNCVWDAIDVYFNNIYGSMEHDREEFDHWVENAPLFNHEWRAQLSDVEDIRQKGMSYSTIAFIKAKAIRNRVAINDARDPH